MITSEEFEGQQQTETRDDSVADPAVLPLSLLGDGGEMGGGKGGMGAGGIGMTSIPADGAALYRAGKFRRGDPSAGGRDSLSYRDRTTSQLVVPRNGSRAPRPSRARHWLDQTAQPPTEHRTGPVLGGAGNPPRPQRGRGVDHLRPRLSGRPFRPLSTSNRAASSPGTNESLAWSLSCRLSAQGP